MSADSVGTVDIYTYIYMYNYCINIYILLVLRFCW